MRYNAISFEGKLAPAITELSNNLNLIVTCEPPKRNSSANRRNFSHRGANVDMGPHCPTCTIYTAYLIYNTQRCIQMAMTLRPYLCSRLKYTHDCIDVAIQVFIDRFPESERLIDTSKMNINEPDKHLIRFLLIDFLNELS